MPERAIAKASVAVLLAVPWLAASLVLAPGATSANASTPASGCEAWGGNTYGQLGDGTTTDSDVPVAVSDLSAVQSVAAGSDFVLALLQNGTVMAWGDNTYGQLGDGNTTDSDVPVAVSGLSGVREVKAGDLFSLAIVPYGTVLAWGANSSGQLGDGTTTDSDVPVEVSGLSNDVRSVEAGGAFALAVLGDEDVVAWGDNSSGQLGDGNTTDSDVPVAVPDLTGVYNVRAGADQSLAQLTNATVMAWGDNSSGQLGNGTTTDSDVPVAVPDLTGVSKISAGGDFSLAKVRVRPASLPTEGRASVFVGSAFTKTIRSYSHPTFATITESGALPSGVVFTDNGDDTASLSGDPAAGTAGTYVLSVTASNGFGSPATETYVLTVKNPRPPA